VLTNTEVRLKRPNPKAAQFIQNVRSSFRSRAHRAGGTSTTRMIAKSRRDP
jgi:hypothetical protein